MLNFLYNQVDARITVDVMLDRLKIGNATLVVSPSAFTLTWIEINENQQRRGYGSMCMDYILDQLISNERDFKIQIVDNETVGFYLKYFQKRGFTTQEINTWINDSGLHPTLLIQKECLPLTKILRRTSTLG